MTGAISLFLPAIAAGVPIRVHEESVIQKEVIDHEIVKGPVRRGKRDDEPGSEHEAGSTAGGRPEGGAPFVEGRRVNL